MNMFNKTLFAQQVRKALDHLHDVVYLQNLELTQLFSQHYNAPLMEGARRLRGELLSAIDGTEPGSHVPPRARERRPYAILYGRYVQRMSTAELTEELAISVRQFRRENKRALEAIIERLWEEWANLSAVKLDTAENNEHAMPEPHERRAAARIETQQLIEHAQAEMLSLPALVNSILSVLKPVAAKYRVQLHNHLPPDLPAVQADRVVLRQALMELLAFALDRAHAGQVIIERVAPSHGESAVCIGLTARGAGENSERAGVSLEVSEQLVASMSGALRIDASQAQWQATLTLPRVESVPIVVMDDNAGLVQLFRRYLVDSPCQIYEAHLAEEAAALVEAIEPRLILLDVMMPEQDGWEILQKLRAAPASAHTPIIICSVLNEPEIALTLGATDYLPKPVTQDALLAKIARWI